METTFRRAKLSLLSAVRIGSHGMLQKPVRLLVVLFLTAVALILFRALRHRRDVRRGQGDRREHGALRPCGTRDEARREPFFPRKISPCSKKGRARRSARFRPAAAGAPIPGSCSSRRAKTRAWADLTHCITKSPDGMIVLSGSGARRGGGLYPHGAAAGRNGGDRPPRLPCGTVRRAQLLRRDRKPAGVS